jgi:hypothetical protein
MKMNALTISHTPSVLRVGHGRGFVVQLDDEQRVVVPAAHCWGPRLPYSHIANVDRIRRLLCPLERKRPTIWAELLFGDPVADIAVFGAPDSQFLPMEWEAYEQLLAAMQPLPIANAPVMTRTVKKSDWGEWPIEEPGIGSAHVLSLDGQWT